MSYSIFSTVAHIISIQTCLVSHEGLILIQRLKEKKKLFFSKSHLYTATEGGDDCITKNK